MIQLSAFRRSALIACTLLWFGFSAWAAPRYTDRENALALADVLQNGVFRENLIDSTFIAGVGDNQYFIKVVLDNGTSQDWTLDQIHQWTRSEEILLPGNRVLLFPRESSNGFVLLDKGAFTRRALTAEVYTKVYEAGDPLVGTEISYAIRDFNLTNLLGLSPGRDAQGYRYHYVFDLVNGQREFLSYLDAYKTLQRDGLRTSDPVGVTVMVWPYRLQGLVAHEVGAQDDNGIARFAIEMVFNRPVELSPQHFPTQMFEDNQQFRDRFVLEVTVPNSELGTGVGTLGPVEYIQTISARSDAQYQKRLLLQANISPDVMEFPPEITVLGNSVFVNFLKVVDQTVLSRRALLLANLRRQQEALLERRMTPEQLRMRREFIINFEAAFAQMDLARIETDFTRKVVLLTTALANFNAAAGVSTIDEELQDALRQRNLLQARIPIMIADHVRAQMARPPIENPVALRELVVTGASLTRDLDILRVLREFLRRLGG